MQLDQKLLLHLKDVRPDPVVCQSLFAYLHSRVGSVREIHRIAAMAVLARARPTLLTCTGKAQVESTGFCYFAPMQRQEHNSTK